MAGLADGSIGLLIYRLLGFLLAGLPLGFATTFLLLVEGDCVCGLSLVSAVTTDCSVFSVSSISGKAFFSELDSGLFLIFFLFLSLLLLSPYLFSYILVICHCWAMDRMLLHREYSTNPDGKKKKNTLNASGMICITLA